MNPSNQQDSATEIKPYEVLIAADLDPRFNYRRLEYSWYGLWIVVLRIFESVIGCQVHDQYALWMIGDEDDMRSDFQPSPGYYNIPDVYTTPINQRTRTARRQDLLHSAVSPLQALQVQKPIFNVERKTKEIIENNISAKSFYGSFNPVPGPSTPRTTQEEEPYPAVTSPSFSVDNTPVKLVEKHRIPDFVVCHYLSHREEMIQVAKRPNVRISRRVIPIVLEVKHYRCYNDDHDSGASITGSNAMITKAIEGLQPQIQYLFSPQSHEGKQSAVIAIAASGFFWSWCQFFNYEGVPVPNMELNTTNEFGNEWSKRYEIGTKLSDEMFKGICKWVEKFVENPDAKNPPIILEPVMKKKTV